MLDANPETNKVRGDTASGLGGLIELAACGAGTMDGQGFGDAHVGEVAEELQLIDELAAGIPAAFDPKDKQAPPLAASNPCQDKGR